MYFILAKLSNIIYSINIAGNKNHLNVSSNVFPRYCLRLYTAPFYRVLNLVLIFTTNWLAVNIWPYGLLDFTSVDRPDKEVQHSSHRWDLSIFFLGSIGSKRDIRIQITIQKYVVFTVRTKWTSRITSTWDRESNQCIYY